MKNLLLLFFISCSFVSFSQNEKTKRNLKKMHCDVSELAYTKEKVYVFPRGFIYDVSKPDSVGYLSCISADIEEVNAYFEGNSKFVFESYSTLIRYVDTIVVQPLNLQLKNFTSTNGSPYILNNSTKYVIMYYWSNGVTDRFFVKNFRFLKKYARQHPELNIQVIAVSTDKIRE